VIGNLPESERRGRILRVKHGYNPNSSSMGSIVFGMSASLFAVAGAFGIASAVLFSALVKPSRDAQKLGGDHGGAPTQTMDGDSEPE